MPDERLTKRERREQARHERKQKEAEAERQARLRRVWTIVGIVGGAIGIAALIILTREPPVESGIAITAAEAEGSWETAGCVPQQMFPIDSAAHLDPSTAPAARLLYPVRPTHGGPHLPGPLPTGVYGDPVDERASTHSLEHGAVIAWYDADLVSGDMVSAMESWGRARNRAGFAVSPAQGGGIIVAPFPDGIDSGKAVALRAWNAAVDCDDFDETAVDTFLILAFGSRGQAPEGQFNPYPEQILGFEGEPPTLPGLSGETPTETDTDVATEEPTEASS
ncbi:MAG: DUF3105 domain-containing protein [Nitriliruptorales bacterium]